MADMLAQAWLWVAHSFENKRLAAFACAAGFACVVAAAVVVFGP